MTLNQTERISIRSTNSHSIQPILLWRMTHGKSSLFDTLHDVTIFCRNISPAKRRGERETCFNLLWKSSSKMNCASSQHKNTRCKIPDKDSGPFYMHGRYILSQMLYFGSLPHSKSWHADLASNTLFPVDNAIVNVIDIRKYQRAAFFPQMHQFGSLGNAKEGQTLQDKGFNLVTNEASPY